MQRWLAQGPRAVRGFVGQRKVRRKFSVDDCHEKTGMIPKDRMWFFDIPLYTVESKEYGGMASDRERKPVLMAGDCD